MWTVLLFLIIIYLLYINVRRPKYYPPGPGLWLLIRNLLSANEKTNKSRYHESIWQKLSRKYGDVVGLKFGFVNVVVVSGKDRIREVASREVFDGRPSGFFYRMRSFGRRNLGIVFSEGKNWHLTQKSLLKYLKTFGFGKQRMEELIGIECQSIIKIISENVGTPLVGNDFFNVAVLNVLWRLMARKRYELDDPKLKMICEMIKEIFVATDMSGGIINFLPILCYIIPNYVGYNNLVDVHKKIYGFITETIMEHKENLDIENPRDVIDSLLIEMTQQGNETFTEENIKVICLDMLEAGMETVGNTLDFLIIYLVLHEDVQQRIQLEIDTIIGSSRLPSLDDRNRMKYTEAVILESLRLSSVAPVGIPHCSVEDAQLGDYIIPKGTTLMLSLYDLHNNDSWEEPNVFSPERFLSENGELTRSDSFIPFGLGKRRCIGENLARSELFLFTTYILQKFKIVLPDDEPRPSMEAVPGISLSAKPFKIMYQHRNL